MPKRPLTEGESQPNQTKCLASYFVYHDLELLEERAADNSTVLRRFYGSGHVDVADSGKRYAYTTDHLGSIREVMLLDGTSGNPTTATLAARYDYDLWGKRTVLDGGSAAETLVMHGYTGHVYHPWSGLWLAPYRAYSSGMGRWISRDPIAEDGGVNLYAYVDNDPLRWIDPLGLTSNDPMANARNAMAGAADLLSFGLGGWLRKKAEDKGWAPKGAIDECSPPYSFGQTAALAAAITKIFTSLAGAAEKAVERALANRAAAAARAHAEAQRAAAVVLPSKLDKSQCCSGGLLMGWVA